MTMSLEEHLLAMYIDRTLPFKSIAMSKIADTVSEFFSVFGLYLDKKVMSFKNAKLWLYLAIMLLCSHSNTYLTDTIFSFLTVESQYWDGVGGGWGLLSQYILSMTLDQVGFQGKRDDHSKQI